MEGKEVRFGVTLSALFAVITTAAMNEAAKSAWCREHGVYPAELDKWRASATNALADPEDARAIVEPALQLMIDAVDRHTYKWRMEENLGKCGVLSVRANGRHMAGVLPLQMMGEDVEEVKSYLYLGVHIQRIWDGRSRSFTSRRKLRSD